MKLIAIGTLLIGLCTGCAFTRTKTNLEFTNFAQLRTAQIQSTVPVSVGPVRDSRSVKDPHVIMHKKNGYGQTTTGAYVTERPVGELFRDAIQETLSASGFVVAEENGRYELRTNIQDFDFEVITGFWKGTVKPKLSVRFELVDPDTGSSVWHDTYVGRQTFETGWESAELVAEMFSNSAMDVLDQLVNDANFQAELASTNSANHAP